jgi:hypothetical protein
MRNILMTVMLLIVVVLMFSNIIAKSDTGTRAQIEKHGTYANTQIANLAP